MSGSEPGEMASESSKAVVLPKFDMHVYTSELTSEELKTIVTEYCVPTDLHPRLPPPGMTMDSLLSCYIELYVEQLEQRGCGFRFPPFFLAVIKHFGVHVSQLVPIGVNRVILFEIRLIDINTFLKLPSWTGTVVGKGDPIPEEQRLKPRVTPHLSVETKLSELTTAQKNLERPDAKIAAAQEKKEQQNLSGSKATLSATPIHQASPEVGKKPAAATAEIAKDTPRTKKVIVDLSGNTRVSTPPAEVNQPSPPREHDDTHVSPHLDVHSQSSHHGNEDEPVANKYVPDWELRNDLRVCTFKACKELVSHLATLVEDEFLGSLSNAELEELDRLRPGLRRTTQENDDLNQRLTLLDNAHSECLPREKELLDRVKDLERERDKWRETTSNQVEKIRSIKKDLEPRTQQLVAAEEKVGVLEGEKLDLLGKVAQAEADRKKLVREFLPAVVKRLHTSVEYQKSLATPVQLCYTAGWLGGLSLGRTEDQIAQLLSEIRDLDIKGSKSWQTKHRELFTMSYPYVQKFADSCDLPMNELLAVYPDIPPSPVTEGPTSGVAVEDAAQQPPASASKTSTDIPFGTTT
ncbi:hypothetical protein Tco_0811784 [Tanacetum coccineum]